MFNRQVAKGGYTRAKQEPGAAAGRLVRAVSPRERWLPLHFAAQHGAPAGAGARPCQGVEFGPVAIRRCSAARPPVGRE